MKYRSCLIPDVTCFAGILDRCIGKISSIGISHSSHLSTSSFHTEAENKVMEERWLDKRRMSVPYSSQASFAHSPLMPSS
ncbi:hypothetical protein MHYP_G00332480 [Metynnis hypsauchen]